MKCCIYTAIFGNVENKLLPIRSDNIDCICFTDNKNFSKDSGWIIKDVPGDIQNFDNKRKNRCLKFQSHVFLNEYDSVLYIDGNIEATKKISVDFFERTKDLDKIYLFKHPYRNCIFDEAATVKKMKYDNGMFIDNLVKEYLKDNFPKKYGLSQNNIILRNNRSEKTNILFDSIWNRIKDKNSCYRDQLYMFYYIWKYNLLENIVWLPRDLYKGNDKYYTNKNALFVRKNHRVNADKQK